MRFRTVWMHLMVLGAISGCTAVYATKPVGEVPCPVKAAEWEGTWANAQGTVTLKVQNEEAGMLRAAWVEWSVQGPRLEVHDIQLLRSGEAIFANVKEGEDNGSALYVWARVKREGNELVCWPPDFERFKAASRSGQFPYRERDDSLVLGELTPEHLRVLASPEAALLYRWDDPVVLLRINSGDN